MFPAVMTRDNWHELCAVLGPVEESGCSIAALEKVNVPEDPVETFERVSLAAKIFHSVSGEMLLLRHN